MNELINKLILAVNKRIDKEGDYLSPGTFALLEELTRTLGAFGSYGVEISLLANRLLDISLRRFEAEKETESGLSWQTVELMKRVRELFVYL